MKLDDAVKKQSILLLLWVIILSAMMEAVFLLIGKWNYTVILGNLLGACAAWGNFFLMALTVQSAVHSENDDVKMKMRASQAFRYLGVAAVCALGCLLDCFDTVAVILPLFFPGVFVFVGNFFYGKSLRDKAKLEEKGNSEDKEESDGE